MIQADPIILLYADRPIVGNSLPALAGSMQAQDRAHLANALLMDITEVLRQCAYTVVVGFPTGSERSYFLELAPGFELGEYDGVTSAEQVENAIREHFEQTQRAVIVLHQHITGLTRQTLQHAAERLEEPTINLLIYANRAGHYCFFGIKQRQPEIISLILHDQVEAALAHARRSNITSVHQSDGRRLVSPTDLVSHLQTAPVGRYTHHQLQQFKQTKD